MATCPAALRHLEENITLHGGHRESIRTGSTVLVRDYSYLGKSVDVFVDSWREVANIFYEDPYQRQLCPSLSSRLLYQLLARSGKHLQ